MKIITTPMCKYAVKFAGLSDFIVVKNGNFDDADLAIVLSETETDIGSIKIKLNTYSQIYNSIIKLSDIFKTKTDEKVMEHLQAKIRDIQDLKKVNEKRKIKVRVYSNFIKDIVKDMGFFIVQDNREKEFINIIYPDYLENEIEFKEGYNFISLPSHNNVPLNPLKRAELRYDLLERKLCMKP
ncbi:MAG: hypothetical protein QME14_06175 [Methanobacteriaceae archaeon]|nr:hypothetical protein [Methanobacteriaceae archaeon]